MGFILFYRKKVLNIKSEEGKLLMDDLNDRMTTGCWKSPEGDMPPLVLGLAKLLKAIGAPERPNPIHLLTTIIFAAFAALPIHKLLDLRTISELIG